MTQGKPGIGLASMSCSGALQQGKSSVAYVRSQRQCCGLSEHRHRLVVTLDLDLRPFDPRPIINGFP